MVDICSVWGFSPIGLCAKDTDDVVRRWSVGIVAVTGWAREPGGDGILFACWLSMMRQMMASSSRWVQSIDATSITASKVIRGSGAGSMPN